MEHLQQFSVKGVDLSIYLSIFKSKNMFVKVCSATITCDF